MNDNPFVLLLMHSDIWREFCKTLNAAGFNWILDMMLTLLHIDH
jgi:hypothetical protein